MFLKSSYTLLNCVFLILRENCKVICASGESWQTTGCPGSQLFTSKGTFAVPKGVNSVRLLLVGGGSSGDNGEFGGGGGGYVACGNVDVSNVTDVSVIVGAGGVIVPSAGTFHSCY